MRHLQQMCMKCVFVGARVCLWIQFDFGYGKGVAIYHPSIPTNDVSVSVPTQIMILSEVFAIIITPSVFANFD